MFLNHSHIAYKGYILYITIILKETEKRRKEQKEEFIQMLTPDPTVAPRLYCEEAM